MIAALDQIRLDAEKALEKERAARKCSGNSGNSGKFYLDEGYLEQLGGGDSDIFEDSDNDSGGSCSAPSEDHCDDA